MQGLAKSVWARCLNATVPVTAAAVFLMALPSAAAPPLDAEAAAARQERARLADADSLLALTADGAALYARDPAKRSGYQYCSQAVALTEAGELRQGVRAASKALYLADATNDANLRALANRDMAIVYSYAGQFDKAAEFAREALRYPTRDPKLVVGPANKVIGDVLARRGDDVGAIAVYETALAGSSERYAPVVQVSLVNALIGAGSPPDLARAEQILATFRTPADPALAAQLERARARLLLAQNKPEQARAAYRQLTTRNTGADSNYYRLWAWDGVARASLALGDKQGAAEAVEQALSNVDAARARFRSEEFKMGLFSDVQAVFDRGIGLYHELGDEPRAFALSEKSRSRALLDAVRGRAALGDLGTSTVDLPALQHALTPDERVVQFHALPDRLLVWVVSPDAITAKTIALKRGELGELVETFRNTVVRGRNAAITNADKLGVALIAPLGLAPGQRLIVVPHGPLHYLPFQALRVDGRYLIETHPVAVAPSASIAAQLTQRGARAEATLTAFGNPRIADQYDLPGAQAEVEQIARVLPRHHLYLGAAATKTQFGQAVADAPIVHVAAHAQADEIDPLYSRILLANENGQQNFLEAHEIIGLPLQHTALVTLSACESGLGRVVGGDEVLGFPRSFLSAGTAALITSLWPVSDDATALLMSTLYRELARGRDLQHAMQAGQLAVLHQPQTAHPFFWAPFNLMGNWRLTVSSGQSSQ
jgi:CHAT domain-containing protein